MEEFSAKQVDFIKHLQDVTDDRVNMPSRQTKESWIDFLMSAYKILCNVEKTLPESLERHQELVSLDNLLATIPNIFGQVTVEALKWLSHWETTTGRLVGAFSHFPATDIFTKYCWLALHQVTKINISLGAEELDLIGCDLATRLDRLEDWL